MVQLHVVTLLASPSPTHARNSAASWLCLIIDHPLINPLTQTINYSVILLYIAIVMLYRLVLLQIRSIIQDIRTIEKVSLVGVVCLHPSVYFIPVIKFVFISEV